MTNKPKPRATSAPPKPVIITDLVYMAHALRLAEQAASEGEVPVGAIIVRAGQVIAEGYNRREALADPCAHAEIIAIRQAAEALGRWRLSDCELYVTLEPCPMCAGALVNARVATLVFGTRDPRAGAIMTQFGIGLSPPLNHVFAVREGVRAEECGRILVEFFAKRRTKERV